MSPRPAILLDCDPGHDDAVALLVAAVHSELVGVTTVCGNAPLPHVTRNALAVCELFALDVPVHAGCDRPLIGEATHAVATHGETGLGGTTLPEPSRPVGDVHAVEFLIETTRAREGLSLVPIGPLTNIALAVRLDPALPGRLAGITLMGGGATIGNVTPTAEFNIWSDPEAAAIVFASGAPLQMVGLDVTHQVGVTVEHAEPLAALGTARGAFLADVLRFYGTKAAGRPSPMHDPLAVLALTHSELLTFAPRAVTIELTGSTRGTTVVDRRWFRDPDDANAAVAEAVDADAALALILRTLADLAAK